MKTRRENKPEKEARIASLSPLDFNFTVYLTEEEMREYNIDIDTVEKVSDLKFLDEDESLYDKIQLSSNNSVVNTMFYINKAYSTRSFVEIMAMQGLRFTEENEFLEDAIKHVTETRGFIFLKELTFDCPPKVSFQVKCGKKVSKQVSLSFAKRVEEEKDDKIIEKEKRKRINKIINSLEPFDYFFLDLNEIAKVQEVLSIEDVRNIVKKALTTYKSLSLIVSCPNIIDNDNLGIDMELFTIIQDILGYADMCIFEKKDSLNFLNTLSILGGGQDYVIPQEKHLEPLFLTTIKCLRKSRKIALFLDEFNKVHVFERNGDYIINRNVYEFLLYPRINHTNQKVVDEYKRHIILNYNLLKSVFLGGFLSRLINKQPLYPSYLVGSEMTKRILEIFKNKMDIPLQNEFYVVKLQKSKVEKELQREQLKKQEQKFVLDCVNTRSSSLKHYNPLLDDHLHTYFASNYVRKQLKTKGFIDTKGFLLYDSVYKNSFGVSPHRKLNTLNDSEREKKLLYTIRHRNLLVSVFINT
jgi:hypothetical protein